MHKPTLKKFQEIAHEVSGSLGDLGTFLPLVLGGIAVAGCNPGAVFSLFGLFYLATGFVYRLPVPVQPMKVAAAALLTGTVTTAELSGATLVIGVILLLFSLSGITERLARWIPAAAVTGIQTGLGIMLGFLGLQMVFREPLIGLATLVVMVPLGFNRLLPQALVGLLIGLLLTWGVDGVPSMPACTPHLQLPALAVPGWNDVWRGTIRIGLPQLSLTLINSVIITSLLAGRFFPGNLCATPRRLTLTMGIANCISGFMGGIPMCHGAGGLASHYRFGARTGLAPIMLGTGLLLIGTLFADFGARLLALVPMASLGALLFWSSLEMVRCGKKPVDAGEFLLVALAAVLTIWGNAAIALLAGLILERMRRWLSPVKDGEALRTTTVDGEELRTVVGVRAE